MAHSIDMVVDFQYGSTGKGAICGWLAKRKTYDTVACAFATNAGHTYIDKSKGLHVMTQQIPTAAIVSDTIKYVLIGPGALIHRETFERELETYWHRLKDKIILIHPHAAVVEDYHAAAEKDGGLTKIGSTAKGVGAAAIERIMRDPDNPNIAAVRFNGTKAGLFVTTQEHYNDVVYHSDEILVEGAQGFSLSMYHGQYPYTTSRDVTPWQIAADCGLPFRYAPYVKVIGTLRTFPIRVNNRDGSSGPHYLDQHEIEWAEIGLEPEKTTVTKLPRRIFTFSKMQLDEALYHCGGYWDTRLFLNFVNYLPNATDIEALVKQIKKQTPKNMNVPTVAWLGYGPDDADIKEY